MMAFQVYFDLDKKAFTFDVAKSLVKVIVSKYGLKTLIPRYGQRAGVTEDIEDGARKLYNEGKGGSVTFVDLPYTGLGIEAHTSDQSVRVPKNKLYIHIGTDMTNLRTEKSLQEFVDDAIMVYDALKPKLGLGGIESSFEFDGTHFLRGLYVCPLMLLGPQMVKTIGTDRVMALKDQIFEVRRLSDGGVMLRLMKIKANEQLSSNLEDAVRRELGIETKW